jgi:pantothenate kinase
MSGEAKPEAAAILEALRYCRPAPWVIAIAGIPGAGKSTVAADVASRVPGAAVIPMDGYHLLLSEWQLSPMFDFTVFLDCDLDLAMNRVADRHLQ